MTTTKVEASLGKERTLFTCSTPSVDLVVDSETIAWIVLNNKEKPVNVIGLQFITDMRKVLEIVNQLIDEKKVRVIVFYSEKSTFLAGADIHGMYPVVNEKIGADVARSGQRLFDQVNAIKVPTIAAINGSALGGGLELCLACTYRVAAKDSKAMIGLPEVKLGLIPGAGGTVRLPKVAGLQESLKIILAGGAVDPFKAKKIGIVDFLIDHEDRHPNENRFFNNVRQIAGKMVDQPSNRRSFKSKTFSEMLLNDNWIGRSFVANTALKGLDKSTKGKYIAPYKALESVMNSYKAPISRALDFEAQSFGKVCVSPESKNLMSIFFLQEQAKKMESKVDAKPMDVKKIGVVGAGVMGSGIAQLFAHKDFPVYMKDIKEEFVNKGLENVANLFGGLAKRGKLSAAEADRKRKLVSGGSSNNGFADAQVVVEAAIERMDLKKKILQEIEAISPNVIFATNTSTLSITDLASVAKIPENVVGFHFFNPVHKMPLVEIIRGKQTSDKTVATIYKLALKLGKVPVVVNDGPGFLVNRILGIYMLEAARLLKEGGDIQQIDQVIVNFGMPMGPFRLIDEVGLDVAAHSASTLESLGSRYSQKDANEMQKLVGQGYLGKKSGKGFYRYKDGKSQGLEPTLSEVIPGYNPNSRRKLPPEDIVDRCILLMVNEAAYILDEKIADAPEDVDLAMVMGTGFAPFRGGLLSFADNRGAKNIVKRLSSFQPKYGDRFKPAPLLLKMAQENTKFFPNRPNVPYHERSAPPRAKL